MEEKIAGLKAAAEENRKRNNLKFLALAFICCMYFLVPSGLVIFSATLFLFWIFYSIKKQSKERVRVFKEHQDGVIEQFKLWKRRQFSEPDHVLCACGYLESKEGFQDVNIFLDGNQIIVKELLFQEFFVYSINNEFWYLFDMKKEEKPELERVDRAQLPFEKYPENHQEFLRKKGIQWERLDIVEGYIYNRFLKQMLSGTFVGRIAMDDGIDSLRKESLYAARTPGGNMLYLAEPALKMLNCREV